MMLYLLVFLAGLVIGGTIGAMLAHEDAYWEGVSKGLDASREAFIAASGADNGHTWHA